MGSNSRPIVLTGQEGFSLWEVILVLTILGMVAFLAVPNFWPAVDTAKSQVHKTNLLLLERAVRLYYLDTGKYPERMEMLVIKPFGNEKWQGPYLKEIPGYPYDSKKHYEVTANGKIIISFRSRVYPSGYSYGIIYFQCGFNRFFQLGSNGCFSQQPSA